MQLAFTADFTRHFPADPELGRHSRALPQALYAWVTPEPLDQPHLLLWSEAVAALLGGGFENVSKAERVAVLSGNAVAAGSRPYATVYGGHQFGHWAGQLGDGRAINLGEIGKYTLQLKGAGRTPCSRHADGRAVLRSSIREFLCSEAMHALGIPSTRALSLIGSESTVVRDMFYDGHPQHENCAVVCRVSESFLRFGHFQWLASQANIPLLQQLADFVIRNHFPDIDASAPDAVARLFVAICEDTAALMAGWMSVGFVHGVMNTDNMSVLSETIDYGPYGWLEQYDNQWTPNTTDAANRRYCYGNQPAIARWNLAQLAQALHPLVQDTESLQAGLSAYQRAFQAHWNRRLAAKLGLPESVLQAHPERQQQLLHMLDALGMDFTLFFDRLTRMAARTHDILSPESLHTLLACSYQQAPGVAPLRDWLACYQSLVLEWPLPERAMLMRAANPVFILRNHLVQDVIDVAEQGDYRALQEIFVRLKTPYRDASDDARWVKKCPPESQQRAGCSMLSCSS